MHELSIAHSLVTLVQQHLPSATVRVTAVDVRLGALAGVVRGALEFCYDVATDGTPLQGSTLRIEDVPVVIHCPTCRANRTLPSVVSFRCPVCDTPSADIREGREIELGAIEYDSDEPQRGSAPTVDEARVE